MLIYIIDAFNVIHKIETVLNSPKPHSDFLHHIMSKHLTGSSMNKVVVVFDGYEPKDQLLESPYEVAFSNARTADDVIKQRVERAKNKRQIVVVSDDRSVRDFARGEGAEVLHTEEFLKRSRRKNPNAAKDDEKLMDEETTEQINKELERLWSK